MIEFIKETFLLLPILFVTYLVLEAVEAKAGGALEKFLGRARCVGPLSGALAGAVPQCGLSAAAASFYAAGVISVGTLVAVFLSTSDELIPVLASKRIPLGVLTKIVVIKLLGALIVGALIDIVCRVTRRGRERKASVKELCEHSHCGCSRHKGIVWPAIIHTAEIFGFIVVVSAAIEIAMHTFGEHSLESLRLTTPIVGEMVAGLIGLVPNCAISVVGAQLYSSGAMSGGSMMALSFTGSGLGLLVLFRTNRSFKENFVILALVYLAGVVLGIAAGPML